LGNYCSWIIYIIWIKVELLNYPILPWFILNGFNTLLFFVIIFFCFPKTITKNNMIISAIISIMSFADHYIDGISIIFIFISIFSILILLKNTIHRTSLRILFFIFELLIVIFTQSIANNLTFRIIESIPTISKSSNFFFFFSVILITIINYTFSIICVHFLLFLKKKIQ